MSGALVLFDLRFALALGHLELAVVEDVATHLSIVLHPERLDPVVLLCKLALEMHMRLTHASELSVTDVGSRNDCDRLRASVLQQMQEIDTSECE